MPSWGEEGGATVDPRFVKGIRYVPTLPTVLSRILALLDDESSSAGDLEGIIQHDQALCSKVLSVANSAYYGFQQEIDTVRRAVVALGYDEIRNICLGAGLMGFLHQSTFHDQDFASQLWLHSLAVAEGSRILAVMTKSEAVDRAFTAGLLHDLGKVVLAAFFPDDQEALRDLREREGMPYREAERALGMEHWEIGMALAKHWDLPPSLGEVMGYHHHLSPRLKHLPLVAAVHLADCAVKEQGIGDSGDDLRGDYQEVGLAMLSNPKEDLAKLHEELKNRREAVEWLWGNLVDGMNQASPNRRP
jgi:putative nucleotidyltransferase with HDIG domain